MFWGCVCSWVWESVFGVRGLVRISVLGIVALGCVLWFARVFGLSGFVFFGFWGLGLGVWGAGCWWFRVLWVGFEVLTWSLGLVFEGWCSRVLGVGFLV